MPVETLQKPQAQVKPNFGEGRYSAMTEECYNDLMAVFKLDSAKAEKLARLIVSDFGAVMRAAPIDTTIKASGKDNKLTLREASKVKGVAGTNPLNIMLALAYVNDCGKHGFIRNDTSWALKSTLTEYIDSL